MTKINLNDVAVEVARMEAGKREVDITQIKEVMKDVCIVLGTHDYGAIIEVMERYKKKYHLVNGNPVERKKTFVDKVKDAVGL